MSIFKKKTDTQPQGRNAFDLSQKRLFTASTGELLPVYCAETLPGDKFEIRVDDFLRTQTCNTAAFARMKQYVHFFFVPFRCLSTRWEKYIMRSPRQESTAFKKFTGDANSASFVDYKERMTFPLYSTLVQLAFIKDRNSDADLDEVLNNNFPYSVLSDENMIKSFHAMQAIKLLDLLEYGVGNLDYSSIGAMNQQQYNFGRQNLNGTLSGKTQQGLNYNSDGTATNAIVRARANPFRLLAYNRIYQDFYRDARLESYNSIYSNIDDQESVDNAGSLTANLFFGSKNVGSGVQLSLEDPRFYIRYRNYPLDYATSADLNPFRQDSLLNTLPFSPQTGPQVATFGTYGSSLNPATSSLLNGVLTDSVQMGLALNPTISNSVPTSWQPNRLAFNSPVAIRAAYALERWASRQAHARSQSYADLVKAHFGVEPSQLDTIFLGGTSAPIVISENVSTAATDDASLGALSGVGKSSLDGKKIEFHAKEHGIIMGIFSIAPEPDYNSWMVDRHNIKTLPEDWYQPEYDNLGYQAVSPIEILNNPMRYLDSALNTATTWPDGAFGFHPIYAEYRTKMDKVFGQFTSYQGLSYWVNARNPYGTNNQITSNFLKVFPFDVDPIFQINYMSRVDGLSINYDVNYTEPNGTKHTPDPIPSYTKAISINDQFFVNFETDCKAIRHMSSDGVLY